MYIVIHIEMKCQTFDNNVKRQRLGYCQRCRVENKNRLNDSNGTFQPFSNWTLNSIGLFALVEWNMHILYCFFIIIYVCKFKCEYFPTH